MNGGDQFGSEFDSPRDSGEQLDTLGAQARIVALPRENFRNRFLIEQERSKCFRAIE
jgi:hypothetical protein